MYVPLRSRTQVHTVGLEPHQSVAVAEPYGAVFVNLRTTKGEDGRGQTIGEIQQFAAVVCYAAFVAEQTIVSADVHIADTVFGHKQSIVAVKLWYEFVVPLFVY